MGSSFAWPDRRKKHLVGVKLDEQEMFELERRAEDLGISCPELLRRMFWTSTVLYDPELTLDKAFNQDMGSVIMETTPLCDILKPLPELASLLGIEHKIWREKKAHESEKVA